MNFKLGFGPMSQLTVATLAQYAEQQKRPLMIIASRNQVDADSGYVMTTAELNNQLSTMRSEYLMLCRDHCGPYFADREKYLDLADAVEATKRTIAGDIENGFDLIHIDTSRCENPYTVAEELFKFCLDLNPKIKFEFGTEENVGTAASLERYRRDVAFASQFPNMEFVVAQTGSLTEEDRQAGMFNSGLVKQLVESAEAAGVKLKEHNADYLTDWQIMLRRRLGVHACNIAPQLGVIQTKTLLELADYYDVDTSAFANLVIASNAWAKWTKSTNPNLQVAVAGHYLFNSDVYRRLEDSVAKHCNARLIIQNRITECLDRYYTNLY